jgi:hypothetical protein
MKLRMVPARQGATWVKMGVLTFFKQPLALAVLFVMFMAAMSALSLVPVLGPVLALTLLPAATLGLMVASQEATKGKFPMPTVLLAAFRAGRQQLRAMLVLGMLYALALFVVLGLSALVDGGQFARLYLGGGVISQELAQQADFQEAALLATVLYLPVSLLFWHAPALVHWHGVSPMKSLFFSMVACLRNVWAFTVFGVVWALTFVFTALLVATIAVLVASPDALGVVLLPFGLTMASMFFTSLYFTFDDTFEVSTGDPA